MTDHILLLSCSRRLLLGFVLAGVVWSGGSADGAEETKPAEAAPAAKPAEEAPATKPADPAAKPKPAGKVSATKPTEAAAKPKPADVAPETKLRFRFRFQRWADVLEWITEQADLSLVLDAPPPGTFNYTDSREYTPTEAIDLLNGVLVTKGYTLIRRGRMLMVVDLKDGIPAGLVPRVKIEELDKRGNFELVEVLFPLDGRDPKAVDGEIGPLLGPHGKSTLLPQTKQILVTDTARVMRAIGVVIQSMPKPEPKPKPPKPEKPVLQVYQVKSVEPQTVVDVVTVLMPEAKVVVDPKTKQVNAYATPSQHAAIKSVVEQMEAGDVPDKRARLEMYPLDETDTTELMATLQLVVPSAQLRIDGETGKLVAWATPEEHEKLKVTLKQLEHDLSPRKTRQLEVYRLTNADPASTLKLLENLLPDAKLAVDAQTRSLIAVAIPADQKAIRAMLEQLQADSPENTRQFAVYRLAEVDPETTLALLQKLLPNAQLTVDAKARSLIAVAIPADQKAIAAMLEQLQAEKPDADRARFESYPLYGADASELLTSLAPLLPEARFSVDTTGTKLIAWATPAEHAQLKSLLEKLGQGGSPENTRQLEVYRLAKVDPETTLALLQKLLPNAQLTVDAKARSLIAVAIPADQKAIKAMLEQLQAERPAGEQQRFESYPLHGADASQIVETLQPLVPGARLSVDTAGTKLIVWATDAEHAQLKATLEKLGKGDTAENARQIQVHHLTKVDPTTAQTLLQKLVPNAQITIDAKANGLIAVAIPADQKAIKAVLDQLQVEAPAGDRPRFESYPLFGADGTALLTSLAPMLPEARLSVDTTGTKLIAWATPAEHRQLKAVLEKLRQGNSPENTRQTKIYQLTKADPSTTLTLLQTLLPNSQLSVDAKTGKLIAIAIPADQQVIQTTLDQLQPDKPGPDTPELRFYPLQKALAASVTAALAGLIPKAQVTAGAEGRRLLVVASPRDHAIVKGAVEQIEKTFAVRERNQLVAYTVTPAQRTRFQAVMTTLTAELPGIKVVTDAEPGELAIWAKPSQHKVLAEILTELKRDVPKEEKYRLVAYPIKTADLQSVRSVLETLFPSTKIVADEKTDRLLIWTRPAEHTAIKSAIEQLDSEKGANRRESFMVYPVRKADPQIAILLLQQLLPDARFVNDTTAGTIVAWARKADHDLVARTLEALQTGPGEEHEPKLTVYPVAKADAQALLTLLTAVVPKALMTVDQKSGGLRAWATPGEHVTIRKIVEQLEVEAQAGLQLRVYDVKATGAATAQTVLATAVPKVEFTTNPTADKLMAWVSAEDHAVIEKVVTQLEEEHARPQERLMRVYSLKERDAEAVLAALDPLLKEEAVFVADSVRNSLVVWAENEKHHQRIQAAVDQLVKELPAEPEPTLTVYPVGKADATALATFLQTIVPEAKITVDQKSGGLAAWAAAKDHVKIRTTVEEMAKQGDGLAAKVVVYDLRTTGAVAAATVLRSAFPDMQFGYGTDGEKLIAWGTAEDHETVAKIVERLEAEAMAKAHWQLKVYDVKATGAENAQTVLASAVPKVEFTAGPNGEKLMAWAAPEDHTVLEKLVKQLEEENSRSHERLMRIYSLEDRDAEAVLAAIDPQMQEKAVFIADPVRHSLVVWADDEQQHAVIQSAVEKLIKELPADPRPTSKVYHFRHGDPQGAQAVLRTLVPDAEMAVDAVNRILVVSALPKDHEKIRAAVDEIDRERILDRELEIFQLEFVDPQTAETAITNLFSDTGEANAPIVDSDRMTQQLLVRATKEQLADIRDLLVKMGEATLTARRGAADSDRRLRVIPFDGDIDEAIKQIEQVWPQLRKNSIRVLKPTRMVPLRPRSGKSNEPSPSKPSTKPAKKEKDESAPVEEPKAPVDEPGEKKSAVEETPGDTLGAALSLDDPRLVAVNAETPEPADGKQKPAKSRPEPPVIVVPGDGTVTIASDDSAALDQFESLLRALSRRMGSAGRSFIVVPLQNTVAANVAETLTQVFRKGSVGVSIGTVTVVPDERLNAVIVHANRVDRATVRSLLEVLDSAEVPDSLAIKRPTLIPVKNTSAERVADVIRNVYKSHMTVGAGRRPIPVPSGTPPRLASVLQQINAAATAPLLTIDVEEKTNSLVVMAPADLLDEITQLVEKLDKAVVEMPSRGVSIIPLKKINSARLQRALDLLIDDYRGSSRNRNRSNSSRRRR